MGLFWFFGIIICSAILHGVAWLILSDEFPKKRRWLLTSVVVVSGILWPISFLAGLGWRYPVYEGLLVRLDSTTLPFSEGNQLVTFILSLAEALAIGLGFSLGIALVLFLAARVTSRFNRLS